MSDCNPNKFFARWVLVTLSLTACFVLSMLIEDKSSAFNAFMTLTSVGFGWYFRDKMAAP